MFIKNEIMSKLYKLFILAVLLCVPFSLLAKIQWTGEAKGFVSFHKIDRSKLELTSAEIIDEDNNGVVDSWESCLLRLKISNKGKVKTGDGCKVLIDMPKEFKDKIELEKTEYSLGKCISSGEERICKIYFRTTKKLKDASNITIPIYLINPSENGKQQILAKTLKFRANAYVKPVVTVENCYVIGEDKTMQDHQKYLMQCVISVTNVGRATDVFLETYSNDNIVITPISSPVTVSQNRSASYMLTLYTNNIVNGKVKVKITPKGEDIKSESNSFDFVIGKNGTTVYNRKQLVKGEPTYNIKTE